jgi:hypothetical protein
MALNKETNKMLSRIPITKAPLGGNMRRRHDSIKMGLKT